MMIRLLALILCVSVLAGCNDARRDTTEKNNPDIRKGMELAQQKNWDKAIHHFETALEQHPDYSRPDLELALIYHQKKKNYVRAIYHYERYLEKEPKTEKAPLIADWIRQAKILLAAEVGRSSEGVSKEIIRLKRENNLLRKQMARLATKSKPKPQPPVDKPAPVEIQKPEKVKPEPTPVSATPIPRHQTPAPVPETYKVLPGDTLSKIARTVYGDSSKWEQIYGANMDKMKNENDLKAGQIITIPKLEE